MPTQTKTSKTAPPQEDSTAEFFTSEALAAIGDGLLKKLPASEQQVIGPLSVTVAKDSELECRRAEIAFSLHEAGTNVFLCRQTMRAMFDYLLVGNLYSWVGDQVSVQTLTGRDEPTIAYAKLLVDGYTQRDKTGAVRFPLTNCNPYTFIRIYLANKKQADCSNADVAADIRDVSKLAQSSDMMRRTQALDKRMSGVSEDPAESMRNGTRAAYAVATMYIIAHELAHRLCVTKAEQCTSAEEDVDRVAFELLLRVSDTAIIEFAILASSQNVITFSSLFHDRDLLYEKNLSQIMVNKEVMRRKASAACVTVKAIDSLSKNHSADLVSFYEEVKKDPLLYALIGNDFGPMRAIMSFQCSLATANTSLNLINP